MENLLVCSSSSLIFYCPPSFYERIVCKKLFLWRLDYLEESCFEAFLFTPCNSGIPIGKTIALATWNRVQSHKNGTIEKYVKIRLLIIEKVPFSHKNFSYQDFSSSTTLIENVLECFDFFTNYLQLLRHTDNCHFSVTEFFGQKHDHSIL